MSLCERFLGGRGEFFVRVEAFLRETAMTSFIFGYGLP